MRVWSICKYFGARHITGILQLFQNKFNKCSTSRVKVNCMKNQTC